jgi:CheY-like chemotaxis protein
LPTILIVDEQALIRSAIRDLFESVSRRFDAGRQKMGAEAIVKAEELKPDLIVLDVSMPVMNGFEAAKILQKILPAVPVFLLTAYYVWKQRCRPLSRLAFARCSPSTTIWLRS